MRRGSLPPREDGASAAPSSLCAVVAGGGFEPPTKGL